jgi:hypothetical protein
MREIGSSNKGRAKIKNTSSLMGDTNISLKMVPAPYRAGIIIA